MATRVKETWTGGTGVQAVNEYSYPRSYTCVDAEKKLVEVVHVSRTKDDLDVYTKSIFDYSNMDLEEILETASRNSVIACRLTEFRTRTLEEAIKADGMVLDARDYFKRERSRGPATPEQLVDKLVKMGVSEAEIAAMIEARTKADAERS